MLCNHTRVPLAPVYCVCYCRCSELQYGVCSEGLSGRMLDWCGVGEAIYCVLKYSELYSIFYTQYTYHRVGNIHKGIGIGVLPLLDLF